MIVLGFFDLHETILMCESDEVFSPNPSHVILGKNAF